VSARSRGSEGHEGGAAAAGQRASKSRVEDGPFLHVHGEAPAWQPAGKASRSQGTEEPNRVVLQIHRAVDPLGDLVPAALARGPARLAQAFGIDRALDGSDMVGR
jgi:hypothetical protein